MSTMVMSRCVLAIAALLSTSIYKYSGRAVGQMRGHRPRNSWHHRTNAEKIRSSDAERTATAEHDRITSLPGLDHEINYEMFSGYLDASPTRHVFYWLVESQKDPDKDPVVLWTNGGPGCSGLLGFGSEHGPFIISRDGTLYENKESWNTLANMLYVEQPAGVGYSYVDSPADKVTGDAQAASDSYQVLLEFFERFPDRRSNDFYIASESYGGHYMPQLALEILQRDLNHIINFKGFLVGNPYVDPFTNMKTQYESYYSHGLLAKPLFDVWVNKCSSADAWLTTECEHVVEEMFEQFGDGINPYALDYPVCHDTVDGYPTVHETSHEPMEDVLQRHYADSSKRTTARHLHTHNQRPGAKESQQPTVHTTSSAGVKTLLNHTKSKVSDDRDQYKPCSQVNLERYFNRNDVRDALHFHEKVKHYDWSPCGGISYSEMDIMSPVTQLYQHLVDMGRKGEHSLNMMVFSGDDDSICSTAGTQAWIWDLGVPARKLWKAWKVNDQTAGFATEFDLGNTTSATFFFVTVHGAGHEVPAYRPVEALDLFCKYLDGTW